MSNIGNQNKAKGKIALIHGDGNKSPKTKVSVKSSTDKQSPSLNNVLPKKDSGRVVAIRQVAKNSTDGRLVTQVVKGSTQAKLSKSNIIKGHGSPAMVQPAGKLKGSMPEINGDKIQERLKKKSPWFDSLVDPMGGGTVKIPDAIGVPTGTMQCYQEFPLTVNANGCVGFKTLTPYPNAIVDSLGSTGSNYQIVTNAGTSSSLAWGANPGSVAGTFAGFPFTGTIVSNALGVRIVSAAVIAYSETTTLTDKGEFCGFQVPWSNSSTSGTYQSLTQRYGSATCAVNQKKPMKSLWYPCSMRNPASGTIDYRDFVNPSSTTFYGDATPTGIPQWCFGVVGTGLEVGSTVKFKVIINYEYIPSLLIQDIVSTSPSTVDLQEEELCISWTDDLPKAGVISMKEANETPTVSSVEPNPTGFGMFADVMSELLPYAAKALPGLLALL